MIGALVAAWVGVAWAVGPGGERKEGPHPEGNTVQEGPWQVRLSGYGGAVVGTVWGGTAFDSGGTACGVCSASGVYFDEYFRKPVAFRWLGSTSTASTAPVWYVRVPQVQPAGEKCTSTAKCQRTKSTATTSAAIRPTLGTLTPTGDTLVTLRAYHAPGQYSITAEELDASGNVKDGTQAYADYWIVYNGSDTRTEILCTPAGFSWPSYSPRESGAFDKEVAWTVNYVSSTAFAGCPTGTTLRSYSVNLVPQ